MEILIAGCGAQGNCSAGVLAKEEGYRAVNSQGTGNGGIGMNRQKGR